MQRIPEPELMDEAEQARAYAMADFAEPNARFVEYFEAEFPDLRTGAVLDLGCGPGDIVMRLATRRAGLTVHGIDGSAAMLRFASESLHESPELGGRVQFIEGRLPGATLPLPGYDAVVSNSLLHHLHDPSRVLAGGAGGGRSGCSRARDGPVPARIPGGGAEPSSTSTPRTNPTCCARISSPRSAPRSSRTRFARRCGRTASMISSVRTVSDRHLLITGHLPRR